MIKRPHIYTLSMSDDDNDILTYTAISLGFSRAEVMQKGLRFMKAYAKIKSQGKKLYVGTDSTDIKELTGID